MRTDEAGNGRRVLSLSLSLSLFLGDAAQSSLAKNSAPRRRVRSLPSTLSLIAGAGSRIGGYGERTGIAEFYKRRT